MAQSQNRPIPNSSRGDAPALACLAVLRVGATGGVVSQPKGGSVVAFHAEVKLFGPQRIDPSSNAAAWCGDLGPRPDCIGAWTRRRHRSEGRWWGEARAKAWQGILLQLAFTHRTKTTKDESHREIGDRPCSTDCSLKVSGKTLCTVPPSRFGPVCRHRVAGARSCRSGDRVLERDFRSLAVLAFLSRGTTRVAGLRRNRARERMGAGTRPRENPELGIAALAPPPCAARREGERLEGGGNLKFSRRQP